MPTAFVSYVREDKPVVDRIARYLESHGVTVWIDRKNLRPGLRWQDEIRRGISDGDFFLACFSQKYAARAKTYMNEELTLAVEELRQRPIDKAWFIPIKLEPCEIPARGIGAGETLQSLQWVDLSADWDNGLKEILSVVRPQAEPIRLERNDLALVTHNVVGSLSLVAHRLDLLRKESRSTGRREVLAESIDDLAAEFEMIMDRFRSFLAVTLALQERPRIFRSEVDLAREIQITALMLEPLAKDRGISFRLGGMENTPLRILADRQLLRAVLVNVMENAIKYSPPAAGPIMIEATRSDHATVFVEISNRGLPISDEELARVFDRGFRGRAAVSTMSSGSGQGLFLARRIMQAQGGGLSIRFDRASEMVVVVIELPLEDQSSRGSRRGE